MARVMTWIPDNPSRIQARSAHQSHVSRASARDLVNQEQPQDQYVHWAILFPECSCSSSVSVLRGKESCSSGSTAFSLDGRAGISVLGDNLVETDIHLSNHVQEESDFEGSHLIVTLSLLSSTSLSAASTNFSSIEIGDSGFSSAHSTVEGSSGVLDSGSLASALSGTSDRGSVVQVLSGVLDSGSLAYVFSGTSDRGSVE
nr:hypothetical protein Iba_chr01bCG16090 [Ipomoea batatas]